MKILEDRIRQDGVLKPGNVLKVDNFLNHQMDIALFFPFYNGLCGYAIGIFRLTKEQNGFNIGILCKVVPVKERTFYGTK